MHYRAYRTREVYSIAGVADRQSCHRRCILVQGLKYNVRVYGVATEDASVAMEKYRGVDGKVYSKYN